MRLSQSSSYLPCNSKPTPAKRVSVSDIKPIRSILKGLAGWVQYLQGWLVNSHEPMIEEKCDRDGNRYWQVYDPITQNLRCFDSENDVRIWLEQRYYQYRQYPSSIRTD